MLRLRSKLYPLLLLVLGLLFFVPFLGYSPLFDGSELRFAEAAREMLVTNTFGYSQLNFLPDNTTSPLLPWLQTLSMRVFGVADNAELAARLPSALLGVVTMLTLFFIGQKKHDAQFGLLWALSYLGSIAPLVLAKSALPATTGYFFILLGFLFISNVIPAKATNEEIQNLLWSSLFFALGLLTIQKLLAGILMLILLVTAYWRVENRSASVKLRNSMLMASLPILGVGMYSGLIPDFNWQRALFHSSNNRNAFNFFYAIGVSLIGILTVITLSSRYWSVGKRLQSAQPQLTFQEWMGLLARTAVVVFIYDPTAILLIWFPLSYLATYHIYQYLRGERAWDRLNTYLLIIDGLLAGLFMMIVPLLGMHPDWLARQTSDPFWVGVTEAPVTWQGWEWLIGVGLMVTTAGFALRIRKQAFQSMIGLYLSTAVCTLAFLVVIVPKIGQYVQGPLVDFCEAKWGQSVYVQPTFPSYAQLFYTRRQPPIDPKSRDIQWLIEGPVDKPTFIITTATEAALYRYNPTLELLSEENGYVFLRRKQYR